MQANGPVGGITKVEGNKVDIRNYTESKAVSNGMARDDNSEQVTSHCPECGCPWYGNKNMLGDGHRVCCDCYQDWWVGIDYKNPAELRELPIS